MTSIRSYFTSTYDTCYNMCSSIHHKRFVERTFFNWTVSSLASFAGKVRFYLKQILFKLI